MDTQINMSSFIVVLHDIINEYRAELDELNMSGGDEERKRRRLADQIAQKKQSSIQYKYGMDIDEFKRKAEELNDAIIKLEAELEEIKDEDIWRVERKQKLSTRITEIKAFLDGPVSLAQQQVEPQATSYPPEIIEQAVGGLYERGVSQEESTDVEEGVEDQGSPAHEVSIKRSFMHSVNIYRSAMHTIEKKFAANGNRPLKVSQICSENKSLQPAVDKAIKKYSDRFVEYPATKGDRGKKIRINDKFINKAEETAHPVHEKKEPAVVQVPLSTFTKPLSKVEEEEMGFYEKELHEIFRLNNNQWNTLALILEKFLKRNPEKNFKRVLRGVNRCFERHPEHFESRQVGYHPHMEFRSRVALKPANDEEKFLLGVGEEDLHIMRMAYQLLRGDQEFTQISTLRSLLASEFRDEDTERVFNRIDTTIAKYLFKFETKGSRMDQDVSLRLGSEHKIEMP